MFLVDFSSSVALDARRISRRRNVVCRGIPRQGDLLPCIVMHVSKKKFDQSGVEFRRVEGDLGGELCASYTSLGVYCMFQLFDSRKEDEITLYVDINGCVKNKRTPGFVIEWLLLALGLENQVIAWQNLEVIDVYHEKLKSAIEFSEKAVGVERDRQERSKSQQRKDRARKVRNSLRIESKTSPTLRISEYRIQDYVVSPVVLHENIDVKKIKANPVSEFKAKRRNLIRQQAGKGLKQLKPKRA